MMRSRVRDDYKFMEIRDAIASINQKVSLIGVIAEFDFPKQTRGTGTAYSLSSIYSLFLSFSL